MFFLDMDLWVCSLDITSASSISNGAKRYFFLLPEWQTLLGYFIIEYIPETFDFVVGSKHQILVISGGLEFEEPWISKLETC